MQRVSHASRPAPQSSTMVPLVPPSRVQDPLSNAATKLASVNASRPMTAGEMSGSASLPMLPPGLKPSGSPYMEDFKLQRELKTLKHRNKELACSCADWQTL